MFEGVTIHPDDRSAKEREAEEKRYEKLEKCGEFAFEFMMDIVTDKDAMLRLKDNYIERFASHLNRANYNEDDESITPLDKYSFYRWTSKTSLVPKEKKLFEVIETLVPDSLIAKINNVLMSL